MSNLVEQTGHRMLDAALTLFARYGFTRTSMADIAREAGVSRATLYLRFADKRALFEALATSLVDGALAQARNAWRDGAPFCDNLEATILAKDLEFFRLMRATPHGGELLALDADLTRAHAERLDAGLAAVLTERAACAADAGADFSAFGGLTEFGHFIAITAAGLKHEARSEEAYRAAVRRLCQVASSAAIRPDAERSV